MKYFTSALLVFIAIQASNLTTASDFKRLRPKRIGRTFNFEDSLIEESLDLRDRSENRHFKDSTTKGKDDDVRDRNPPSYDDESELDYSYGRGNVTWTVPAGQAGPFSIFALGIFMVSMIGLVCVYCYTYCHEQYDDVELHRFKRYRYTAADDKWSTKCTKHDKKPHFQEVELEKTPDSDSTEIVTHSWVDSKKQDQQPDVIESPLLV